MQCLPVVAHASRILNRHICLACRCTPTLGTPILWVSACVHSCRNQSAVECVISGPEPPAAVQEQCASQLAVRAAVQGGSSTCGKLRDALQSCFSRSLPSRTTKHLPIQPPMRFHSGCSKCVCFRDPVPADFDGSVLGECGTSPDELTYATLSLTAIRDARRNWTAENHLYNLVHRGFTAEAKGHATCCFDFYK